MVTYIRSDLEFILEQIKIAEAHALGGTLYDLNGTGLVPAYNLSLGLRTVDGSYNNLLPGQEYWGASGQAFPSYLAPNYRPADGTPFDPDGPGPAQPIQTQPNYLPSSNPNSLVFDSSLRTISNLIVDQTLSNPAAIAEALKRNGIGDTVGEQLDIAATIKAKYETPLSGSAYGGKSILLLFKAVDAADDKLAEAQAAYAVNPTDTNQAAVSSAQSALNAAEALLAEARADPGALPGGSFNDLLEVHGIELSGANVVLTNIAPDVGLSAPFNSWFTLFGQFFDHGLDLINKGGNGTVFVPLQPDDPLYVPGSHTNFMVLTRATVAPGADGAFGTADDVRPVNTTTPFVDQNQTYTSHPSHQVFLREYSMVNGRPEATGRLIEGANGGMANWGELKQYTRDHLGIQLTDTDVGMVPLLRTDPYGNFIPGDRGFPQVIIGVGPDGIPNTSDDLVVQGDPSANGGLGISLANAVRTPMAFLADIAHNAVPTDLADGDIEIGLSNGDGTQTDGTYDNELLDAHFIAGDGRVNENIGLTAVHHVFHSEHNRLLQHTKDVVLGTGDIAFINQWLDAPITAIPADLSTLNWDGERLFQAAKLGTEMQYQHLAFEEFARKIQPAINVFIVPDGYDATINPSIMAEFAHVVYRFGHSMLTESIDRFSADFADDSISLIAGFLNPVEFNNDGQTADGLAAGDIIRGMTRQAGNHIDEFVTSALRNNLLGLPLDLATINLARGRDTGVPTLQAARREFYDVTDHNGQLKPYASWIDFADNLQNEASIINFIAAYGTHDLITSQTTVEGKRNAALTIITGSNAFGFAVPADAEDFLNGRNAFEDDLGGLENVDLWIGGLAEKTMPFGGMLGSTFNFVFEVQMEALQNGDRFYYLQRLVGTNLVTELEGNTFASIIMKNTNATHLPADVFSTPTWILEVDQSKQRNDVDGDGDLESTDPTSGSLTRKLVIRDDPSPTGDDNNYLKYTGEDHVVLGGTSANNKLIAGAGDDTVYGDGGNDIIEGGFGNDLLEGGAGDDIITDTGGDDNLKGGDGNDAIHAGPGLDLVLAGRGNDFVVLGPDVGSEAFGGEGNDFILGSRNSEPSRGNEGDDWLEDGANAAIVGDNFDDVKAGDAIRGNDVLMGADGNFDEFIAEGGDDIMIGSPGAAKMAGMSGFDWATFDRMTFGMSLDLSEGFVFDEAPADTVLNRFESVEGLSGTKFNDTLVGTDSTAADRVPGGPDHAVLGSALDAQGIALIGGLQDLLGAGVSSYSAGDILLGGGGSDTIFGGGGDDYIDGDKFLDVTIEVRGAPVNGVAPILATARSMREISAEVLNGTYNPGQLSIVRQIKIATEGGTDTAVYTGARAEYDINILQGGRVQVVHARGTQVDGTDLLTNIEFLRFANVTVDLIAGTPATGTPVISDQTPREGLALTVNTASIADADGLGAFSYQWQSSGNNGGTWDNITGATLATFTPVDAAGQIFGPQAGRLLRVVVTFTDALGHAERLTSAATAPVGVNWAGNAQPNNFQGTGGDDTANGAGGNDILFGHDGVDTLNGVGGADTLNGGGDNDVLNGGNDNDSLTGGGGNDSIAGGGGTDTAFYALGADRYVLDETGNGLIVTSIDGSEGVDTVNAVEVFRFASIDYTLVLGTGANNILNGTDDRSEIIAGRGGADTLNGGLGNDIILGGAGNDRINQNATDTGKDFIDGGGGNADTYALTGTSEAEVFQIFAITATDNFGFTDLHSTTEIVITRKLASDDPLSKGTVIAELDNVEEILVNTTLNPSNNNGNGTVDGGTVGGDTVAVFGNFTQTSLNYSTITVNGGSGTDMVDITGLTSAHRIVLNANGGADGIIGGQRSQDVVNTAASTSGFVLDQGAIAHLRGSAQAQPHKLFDGAEHRAGSLLTAKLAALMADRGFDGHFSHDWLLERHELRFDDADHLFPA
ncbi:peroxidase family protein [Sphingomonas sp. GCM10030256]|uniref:peroxidase family protein n=1 Tax=Sphingomonas sp. GCM10030256 TaxID=3273427 RepID=UPI0036174311